jgi:hypothetical protein
MELSVRLPMSVAAAAVIVLNLADAVFTLLYVHTGMAREGNPFMASALGGGSVTFMITKLALVSLGVLLLVRLRPRPAASAGLVGSAIAYASLFLYHLSAVPELVSGAAS